MGTSKSYDSPKWPEVNRAVGSAATAGTPSGEEMSSAIGSFTRAYSSYLSSDIRPSGGGRGGGGGGVARVRAAKAGSSLASFVNTASQSGLNAALQQFNLLDLRDKPLDEFLDELTYLLSGEGGLLDDDALTRALAETLEELTQGIDSVEELDLLLSSSDIDIESVLQIYYANLLANNFEQKEYHFIREKLDQKETAQFFQQARDLIRSIVRDELSTERDLSSIDWSSAEGLEIANDINQDVLRILIP